MSLAFITINKCVRRLSQSFAGRSQSAGGFGLAKVVSLSAEAKAKAEIGFSVDRICGGTRPWRAHALTHTQNENKQPRQ